MLASGFRVWGLEAEVWGVESDRVGDAGVANSHRHPVSRYFRQILTVV